MSLDCDSGDGPPVVGGMAQIREELQGPVLNGSVLNGSVERRSAGGSGVADVQVVQMCQLVLPCHANHLGELDAGQLLKWMDIIACLAGRYDPLPTSDL